MAIKNGNLPDADVVMNTLGQQFKNQAQLLYNADYIGWSSKINIATGSPSLKNVKRDVFNTDTASTKFNLVWDSTNKYYTTEDLSQIGYYVVVEASAFAGTIGRSSSYSGGILMISAGKWLIYGVGTAEAARAAVHAIMWGNVSGNGAMAQFTSITAVKVSDATDVGYRGHRIVWSGASWTGNSSTSLTGNFDDTSGNVVSSWSDIDSGSCSQPHSATWQCASGNTLNTASASGGQTTTSYEIGTDTSAEEQTNPANFRLQVGGSDSGSIGTEAVIIFCQGSLSSLSSSGSRTYNDYYTNYGIPITTQADTLANEGVTDATLIFQTSGLSTVTDCIPTWNSSIGATNTMVVSISADATNYETATDATIQRFSNTGTNLYIKFVITRNSTTNVDKISEYAIWYNTGAS